MILKCTLNCNLSYRYGEYFIILYVLMSSWCGLRLSSTAAVVMVRMNSHTTMCSDLAFLHVAATADDTLISYRSFLLLLAFFFSYFSHSHGLCRKSHFISVAYSIVAKRATATTQTEWNRNTRANMKRREERTGSTMRTQNVHTSINIRIICLYKV